jgi:hypothetical protein
MTPTESQESKITPSKIKPGMVFGNWEVIKFNHKNKHGILYYLCKCMVCGTERPVRGTSLISGYSTACSKQCAHSLKGQQFGRWTALKVDKSQPCNYICKCECGTVKSVYSGTLKNGQSKSCGCLKIENIKKKNKQNAESHIGEKYGLLTIKDCHIRKTKNGECKYYYDCVCECGNKITVAGSNLFNGNTSSCGCLNSKANMIMDKILTEKSIFFKREYCFEDCRDKKPLPFDFALFNNYDELIGLIELNGSQHYSATGSGWRTPERLVYIQKHDYIKRLFCEENRIPLLVIPYQFFNELEKFLITSDFWQIITKNFND